MKKIFQKISDKVDSYLMKLAGYRDLPARHLVLIIVFYLAIGYLIVSIAFQIFLAISPEQKDTFSVKEATQLKINQVEVNLKDLKKSEVIIIQSLENEKIRIQSIAIDSLQHYADSLYNSPASR